MFFPLLLYLLPSLSGSDKEAASSKPLRVVLMDWGAGTETLERREMSWLQWRRVPMEGSPFCFNSEIWASAIVTSYPPVFFLFLWTSGSQPDLIWSPYPTNLGKLGNVHRHFWLSPLVLSGSGPRMLLNIHNKLFNCKVSNARIEKLL